MRRNLIILSLVLFGLLAASNLYWFFETLDLAATEKYRQQLLYESRNEAQALQKLILALDSTSTKDDVLAALKREFPDSVPFEKHELLNSTWLSFRFGSDGRLVEVLTSSDLSELMSLNKN